MARIRTIKPEFWTSEQVADCSTTARLLFLGLWNFCDDFGVHPASLKRLRMEVFPGDGFNDSEIRTFVGELIKAGLLLEYKAEGETYWWVTGWHHQKIEKPTQKYPLPPVAEQSSNGSGTIDDHSPPEGKGGEGNGKESKGGDGNGVEELGAAVSEVEFVKTWNSVSGVVKNLGERLTEKRRASFRARVREKSWDWRSALGKFPLKCFDDGGWRPDVDWFLRPDSVRSILEGKYDWSKNARRNGPGQRYDGNASGDPNIGKF